MHKLLSSGLLKRAVLHKHNVLILVLLSGESEKHLLEGRPRYRVVFDPEMRLAALDRREYQAQYHTIRIIL